MDEFRAVYVMADGPIADWLERFWDGASPPDDPLAELLRPADLRGEVVAWGGPHLTLLDALTTTEPTRYDAAVRAACRRVGRPTIRPGDVSVWPTPRWDGDRAVDGSSVVLRCHCPELDALQLELVEATRPLIARSPLADEEWQRAEWWIDRVSPDAEADRGYLDAARRLYREAGRPALPSSRHFRLDRLVRLVRWIDAAPDGQAARRQAALFHFLTHGEPPWATEGGRLHLSVASGLAGRPIARPLLNRVQAQAHQLFGEFRPAGVAVLEASEANRVAVTMTDALTGVALAETRPGLRVREVVPFAG